MIISMKLHATKAEVEAVFERIRDFGYKVHSIAGEERVVIGVVGVGDVTPCLESLEAMPQVEKAVRISAPYKFVSREFSSVKTRVRANGVDDRRRRICRDGRPLLRREREADSSRPRCSWPRTARNFCAGAPSSRAHRRTISREWSARA